ncbi:N-acetylglucosamine kinase [Streptomyces odontomachi]|uniref:N-acetylglucosamine kinase n=1 Tax=Streptomyces odontomachi TaxID=2944940 RepID=UPI002109B8F2|nr:BadF/BadG/BcrA/BcrD ATPase family protein [Streptomyces sp. ODS25]
MTAAAATTGSGAEATGCVLGVDSGGSGLRVQLASPGGATTAPVAAGTPVRTGPGGIDPAHLMELLVPMAEQLLAQAGADALRAVAIGAAGMATLGDALRAELPAMIEKHLGVRRLALAADAVTAYVGALGQRPGAVVAAGTGLIALGTDLGAWRRADGWGHLLGDCGSGAWIGRAGLEAALRAHDGRPGGSAALLARAEAVFGPAPGLPGALYPRTDRAGVLASFAPEVAAAAIDPLPAAHPDGPGAPAASSVRGVPGLPGASEVPGGSADPVSADRAGAVDALATGDPVAAGILRAAARHIAEAAAAVCPAGGPYEVALTGGLLHIGEPLLGPLRRELAAQLPQARQVPAAGGPLDGAVRIALDLADDRLSLPVDGRMLYVRPEPPAASTPAAAEPSG